MDKVILMILNIRFRPDIRVEQEYKALKDAGYRVIIVADMNGTPANDFEVIRVKPNDGISGKYNLTLRKNPKLKKEIIKELKKIDVTKVDAVHVHDLFWSFIGFELKKHFKAKIVIDLHENYPAMIEDFGWKEVRRSLKGYAGILYSILRHPGSGLFWRVIMEKAHSPARLAKYEKRMLKKCDRFIVVVEEALERFKNYDFHKKGLVVSNTKDPESWPYDERKKTGDKLVVTYMGSIQELRGLDTAITAMKYVDPSRFQLNIVGVLPGSKFKSDFTDLIKEYELKNVKLVDRLDERAAHRYINDADICIVPHKNTGLTQTTVPHKLFMYMSIGRPVLVSDVAPLKRIVTDAGCGLVFRAGDAKDFADELMQMTDEQLLSKFAKNGRKAVENKYNWKYDSQRLVQLYGELLD